MAARPGAQDAETIFSVVVGYSFDEARQHLPGIRLQTHVDHRVSRFIPGVPSAYPFPGLMRREGLLLCVVFET